MEAVDVRNRLIDALREDLVGPALPTEELTESPARYLTGYLVPFEDDREDPEADEDLDDAGRAGEGESDGGAPDRASKRKAFLPASVGVSVLLPPGASRLLVTATWGDYVRKERPVEGAPRPAKVWVRKPREVPVVVDLDRSDRGREPFALETDAPPDRCMMVEVMARPRPDGPGQAVSVFLVNRRSKGSPKETSYAFQAGLTVRCEQGFSARPNTRGRGEEGADSDESVAELQYRGIAEHAVGHGIATTAQLDPDGVCRTVRTVWIPDAAVEKVVPAGRDRMGSIELRMEELGRTEDLAAALRPMPEAYRRWIETQAKTPLDVTEHPPVLAQLMTDARYVAKRIERGIEALSDPNVARAFRIANEAMAAAAKRRRPSEAPAWRPFQLAFVLMNLPAVAYPDDSSRRDVDLLFFPTGGGKTEAYLGLAAFTLVLRRLLHPGITGTGTSVLMRYTLRLLTYDQLERATALICALEQIRTKEPALGTWPFEIGLWVGRGATPNRMGKAGDNDKESALARTRAHKDGSNRGPVPIPIERCPWCSKDLAPRSFSLDPDDIAPTRLDVRCVNPECAWSGERPLPIVAVDETIYRRLPCFVIATVDKLAQLPFVGPTGALFGRVSRHDKAGFYGPCDDSRIGAPIPGGRLPPPDLIIQDELHLISGPLGSIAGLYEAAIDALSEAPSGVRPKIIASTATVRRAKEQIRSLFGREETVVFPPPGPDLHDSFFAVTLPVARSAEERAAGKAAHARRYVGVAAQGKSLKAVMLRVYLVLLSAAKHLYDQVGGDAIEDNPAAPYMTLLGYFSSLRELGGSRRIVEDEVRTRLLRYDERTKPGASAAVFARRTLGDVVELTSREKTHVISDVKRRLAVLPREHDKRPVGVALATNMISVGLDIDRLGLMVVLGQPKTTAEYIQATSRVGRHEPRPGLVVTLFNVHRPRDRSHYERFAAYHASFYRSVEATSVTPFSPRAIDRALPAVAVALARLSDPSLTPPDAASRIGERESTARQVLEILRRRVDAALAPQDPADLSSQVAKRAGDLFASWKNIANRAASARGKLVYAATDGPLPLLYDPLDRPPEGDADALKFKAQRSMRDVEPSVAAYVKIPDVPEVG